MRNAQVAAVAHFVEKIERFENPVQRCERGVMRVGWPISCCAQR